MIVYYEEINKSISVAQLIIPLDAKKTFDRLLHLFLLKSLNRNGIKLLK